MVVEMRTFKPPPTVNVRLMQRNGLCPTLEQKNDSLIEYYRVAIVVKKRTLKTLCSVNVR